VSISSLPVLRGAYVALDVHENPIFAFDLQLIALVLRWDAYFAGPRGVKSLLAYTCL
jgi:hypothetical protein